MDFDIHLHGVWHRCASVTLLHEGETSRNGRVRLQYEADYAVEQFGARDHRALTVRAPVDFATRNLPHLLKFPVPEAGESAQDILSHEALYQRVGHRLGLRVTQHLAGELRAMRRA
jgi:hypothetical protein